MERSKRESLNVCMRHDEWGSNSRHLSHSVMCKESNEDDTERHYRTNKQMALTSLQLVYSCVFTCFRFASTLNLLLCLLFCAFVSLIQSSSIFPYIDFSPVCEFLLIVHTAKTGLLRCCLYNVWGVSALCTVLSDLLGHPRPSRWSGPSVPWVSLTGPTGVPTDTQAGWYQGQSANPLAAALTAVASWGCTDCATTNISWRIYPTNCIHSENLIRLSDYQLFRCQTSVSSWDCSL